MDRTPVKESKSNKRKNEKRKKETINVTIKTVTDNPNKICPVVGYFPSGYDPSEHTSDGVGEGSSSSSPKANVKVFRHVKRNNRLQLVVKPIGSQVDFVGSNYSGEAATPQLCTYVLGVLDKATQTLKVVPIAANKIFRLEPRLEEQQENEPSDIAKEELTSEYADELKERTLFYSSKKTIERAKKQKVLRQVQDPMAHENLDKKIESIKINVEALEKIDIIANIQNIPFYDMSATTPHVAYPLEKIIFKGEWDHLLDLFWLSEAGGKVGSDVYPSFVCNRAYKLDMMKDEAEKKQKACILSYLSHLIKFNDKHSIDKVTSAKRHEIPSVLSLKFSSLFANSESKLLADEKRDLLISYVLVLTLFVDEFRTDLSDIAKDLRMNAVALRKHYKRLGCKLERDGNLLLATLPVPLQFPDIRKKRRR